MLGLKTEHAALVVPRVDDCIAMLLGSNEAFSMESEKERGSYYLAKAYLEECDTWSPSTRRWWRSAAASGRST